MAQITRDTVMFSAIRTMALHPGAHLYDSTLALRAMSEAVLFLIAFPLGFTLYFHPELVWTNGLYLVLGYNDVCFAFDSVPANIVARNASDDIAIMQNTFSRPCLISSPGVRRRESSTGTRAAPLAPAVERRHRSLARWKPVVGIAAHSFSYTASSAPPAPAE